MKMRIFVAVEDWDRRRRRILGVHQLVRVREVVPQTVNLFLDDGLRFVLGKIVEVTAPVDDVAVEHSNCPKAPGSKVK